MLNLEQLSEISMQIILNAGDARAIIEEVIVSIEEGKFEEAEEKMAEAKKKISLAHSSQTKAIQGEAMGDKLPYSVLFAHAQDTLMVVMSEWNTTRRFMKLFKKHDERLKKLEGEN